MNPLGLFWMILVLGAALGFLFSFGRRRELSTGRLPDRRTARLEGGLARRPRVATARYGRDGPWVVRNQEGSSAGGPLADLLLTADRQP